MFVRSCRRFACCTSIIVAVASVEPPRTSAQQFSVRWTDERLTVQAQDVPLAVVLQEVARQTHSEFTGIEMVAGTISIEFHDKTLREGVRLLFADLNYLFIDADPAVADGSRGIKAWLQAPRAGDSHGANLARPREMVDGSVDAERDETIRTSAWHALRGHDPSSAAERAASVIGSSDPAINEAASTVIALTDAARAVESLGSALRSTDLATRSAALELLALRNDPASLPYVRQALSDDSEVIRARARELVSVLEEVSTVR
jgi:HEAT repeats